MRVVASYSPAVTPEQFLASVPVADPDDLMAIADKLAAATDVVERGAGRILAQRDFELTAPEGAWSRWWLPIAPVISIASVEVLHRDGETWEAVDPARYRLARCHDEPQLVWRGGGVADREVRARVTAGYPSDAIPLGLRRAIILLAKEWCDADLAIEGKIEAPVLSFGVRSLIRQNRYRRPREVA